MVTFQLQIHDCDSHATRLAYDDEIRKAGAEITDHKINFRTNTITYYIRLKMPDGHDLETFTKKLQGSPIWHLTSWGTRIG